MLGGPAAHIPAQPHCGACFRAHNGVQLQHPRAAGLLSSCSHSLVRSRAARNSMLRRRRQHTSWQHQAASRAACTVVASRRSVLISSLNLVNAQPGRLLSCSNVSLGLAHPPACRHQPHRCKMVSYDARRSVVVRATLDATVQDVLMGSSLAVAIGMALYYGSKGEPEVCEGCGGAGGVRCFACEGSGVMASADDEAEPSPAQQRKGVTGGALRPRAARRGECRACRGSGLLVCKRCSGSGYSKRM